MDIKKQLEEKSFMVHDFRHFEMLKIIQNKETLIRLSDVLEIISSRVQPEVKPANGVRYLPKQEPRIETGNVQFGDDWIGLFLRGDTCAGFVMDLHTVLEGDIDPIIKIRLQYLLELLQGTNESRLSV